MQVNNDSLTPGLLYNVINKQSLWPSTLLELCRRTGHPTTASWQPPAICLTQRSLSIGPSSVISSSSRWQANKTNHRGFEKVRAQNKCLEDRLNSA